MRATPEGTSERSRGRRRALWGLSAAVAVAAGAAGALGVYGGGGHGRDYVAVGTGGRPPSAGPTGGVRLVPLDEPADIGPSPSQAARTPGVPGTSAAGPPSTGADPPARSKSTSTGTGTGTPPQTPGSPHPAGTPSPTPTPTGTTGPAALLTSDPVRTPAEHRWCEDVTLTFRNPGGSPVRSGAVTFGTHVIDALGIDWSTVESTVELPAPLAPGEKKERTWTVCVEAWRVPLGMRVETRDVSVRWE
ncbi:hypothetical protein [Streptomyces griseoruber]|uniref:hypothetical protein n=1 Tax=Streptomyces griseoruber TaxID=1943 RepID=UPI00099E4557|nr:hypothetical protein [Streptomyces griseoruber]